jgi:hypothetical protein
MPNTKVKLLNSDSLTREEEQLRNELVEWCKAKLRRGHRAIPLWVALTIVTEAMKDPEQMEIH